MKTLKIGILGAGIVGRGVIQALRDQRDVLRLRTGLEIETVAVFDRSWEKKRDVLGDIPASDDPSIVVDNDDVELVVELLGGQEPAGTLILKALENGKSVVTANKALLARRGKEIFQKANDKHLQIGFEASVAGALPVIKSLRRSLVVNDFRSIYGILNGTCNFIISRMQFDGMDYGEALKLAQEKGFAEADPSFDVGGNDAAQKLALISGLAFDTFIPEEHVYVEGITGIRKVDLNMAAERKRVIRLLGIARKRDDGKIELRVHPALIPEGHVLASVNDEKNAVFFDTSHSGPTLIMGLGAGSEPTAAAVISDIVSIGMNSGLPEQWFGDDRALDFAKNFDYRFYIRLQTEDRPGVLAEIASILSKRDISIASVNQQEGEAPVQVVVITHEADETKMMDALADINKLDSVKGELSYIRIIDDL